MPLVLPKLVVPVGSWGSVEFAVRTSGASPAEKFLIELGEDAAEFLPLFQEVATTGRTNNDHHFGPEGGGIYAFKKEVKNRQVRFPCFSNRQSLAANVWLLQARRAKRQREVAQGRH